MISQTSAEAKTIDIAIADDFPLWRNAISNIINTFPDCRVTIQATNGRHLIDQLATAGTLPDIVLLDINMPELDGFKTLELIRKAWPNIKVVIFTLFDEEFTMLQAFKKGASGFLAKSCVMEDVKNVIHEVYDNDFFFSSLVSPVNLKRLLNSDIPKISNREAEFLKLNAMETRYDVIASKMGINIRSLEDIQSSLSKKLNMNSRIALAVFALKTGIISLL